MKPTLIARQATPSDHVHYAAMVPELGVDDPILPPDRWSTELMPRTLFFEEDGNVVGYAWVVPMGDIAYVRHVVVGKNARGRGIGGAMMREIASQMRKAGCTSWVLNVKLDNTPAIRLYTSLGFTRAYDSTSMRIGLDIVDRLPVEDERITARLLEPDEDAALEQVFDLPSKRLTELRARNGWVLMRLEDPDKPTELGLGLACFQPHFPGYFPFRVARPALARKFLDAMRPYRLPAFDYVQIFVENDAALRSLLVESGAKVLFEVMHMRGKIPEQDA